MASRKQYSHIDMNGLQTQNLGTPVNNTDSATKTYVDTGLSNNATADRNRANHTGSQLASTISDFTTQVRTNKVTDLAAPTSAFSMNSQKITNLAAPTTSGDAATFDYVNTTSTSDRARANHTGTQLANTISNFDTQVRTSRLDQMSLPGAVVSMNGFRLVNVGAPTASTDAATKAYVDSFPRVFAAVVAPTGNVDLTTPGNLFDLQTMTAGDRMLLTKQNDATQNGLYVWNGASTPPTRATDWDENSEIRIGDAFYIFGGFTNAAATYRFHSPVAFNIGTTALNFRQTSNDTYTLNRTNHIGTQLASTISDFNTAVRINTLNQMSAPTAAVSFANQKITDLGTPTVGTDAATKDYVDSTFAGISGGLVLKGTVRVYVKTNVNIASPGTQLDGVTISAGQKVLLAGQSTFSENGPYIFNSSTTPMTRDPAWDTSAEMTLGSYWVILEGSSADKFALFTNNTAPTVGTTSLFFTAYGGIDYATGYTATLPIPSIAAGATSTIDVTAIGFNSISVYSIFEMSTGNVVDVAVAYSTPASLIIKPDAAMAASTFALNITGNKAL